MVCTVSFFTTPPHVYYYIQVFLRTNYSPYNTPIHVIIVLTATCYFLGADSRSFFIHVKYQQFQFIVQSCFFIVLYNIQNLSIIYIPFFQIEHGLMISTMSSIISKLSLTSWTMSAVSFIVSTGIM